MQKPLNLPRLKKNKMSNFEGRGTDTPPKWRAWMHMAMGVVYLLFAYALFSSAKKIESSTGIIPVALVWFIAYYGVWSGLLRIWLSFRTLKRTKNNNNLVLFLVFQSIQKPLYAYLWPLLNFC
jgi:hypothetical protein